MQYIPKDTVLLCFCFVQILDVGKYVEYFYLYPSGLLQQHYNNHMIAPVPVE